MLSKFVPRHIYDYVIEQYKICRKIMRHDNRIIALQEEMLAQKDVIIASLKRELEYTNSICFIASHFVSEPTIAKQLEDMASS